jgi:hypothetical protein
MAWVDLTKAHLQAGCEERPTCVAEAFVNLRVARQSPCDILVVPASHPGVGSCEERKSGEYYDCELLHDERENSGRSVNLGKAGVERVPG